MKNEQKQHKNSFFSIYLLDNRFPALHGLRMLAMICVVQFHVTTPGLSPKFILEKSRLWIGMDLFFVMSGFLIGGMLLRTLELKSIREELPRFYLRRLLRTVPPYYAIYAALAVFHGLTPFQQQHMTKEMFFLTNYPHTLLNVISWGWSLSLEEHFYLFSPFLVWGLLKIPERWRLWTLTIFFFMPAIQRYLTPVYDGVQFFVYSYAPTHMRYDALIAGVMLAYLEKQHRNYIVNLTQNNLIISVTGFLGCVLLVFAACPFPGNYLVNYKLAAIQVGTLTSLGYILIIFWAIHGKGIVHTILGSRIVRACATLGYSLYLVHVPVRILVYNWKLSVKLNLNESAGFTLELFTVVMVSMGVAYVMHILIEKPCLWLRDQRIVR